MNCYSFPLRCFKKVILRLCENSDLIYEIFTLGKRGVTLKVILVSVKYAFGCMNRLMLTWIVSQKSLTLCESIHNKYESIHVWIISISFESHHHTLSFSKSIQTYSESIQNIHLSSLNRLNIVLTRINLHILFLLPDLPACYMNWFSH